MEENRCVVMADKEEGCSPEFGFECKNNYEAKTLVRWLKENGVRAKVVGHSFFGDVT